MRLTADQRQAFKILWPYHSEDTPTAQRWSHAATCFHGAAMVLSGDAEIFAHWLSEAAWHLCAHSHRVNDPVNMRP